MQNTKEMRQYKCFVLLLMMNTKFILVTLILTTCTAWSQIAQPSISSIDYDVFEGKAILADENGNDYPITIHVSLFEQSSYFYAFSVKGWYYYDRYKTKIPLVGILDNSGLVLFNFEDEAKMREVLHINDNTWNDWEWEDFIDKRKRMDLFKEKFDFSEKMWVSGKKSLRFKVHNQHRLTNHEEYLKLNSHDSTLLPDNHWQYRILSQNENKFILKYSHPSRRNMFEGRCHLGMEEGFLELTIRDDISIESKDYLIESCLQSVHIVTKSEQATQLTGGGEQLRDIKFYYLESGWGNSRSVLMVDLDSCNLENFVSE